MDNTQPVKKSLKHFQRPSYKDVVLQRSLNPRFQTDDDGYPIPRITGFKDNMEYDLTIVNPTNTPGGQPPIFQFSFNVFNSLRTDFPDYNDGDDCDPSYQGNGNTSYILMDMYIGSTRQNAAKIIIQGERITSPTAPRYVFNFLSAKNSLFKVTDGIEEGETMKHLSITMTPYDINDYAGFPMTIMFDKFANSIVFNQYDIDAFHTVKIANNVSIDKFELGSFFTDYYIVPNYKFKPIANRDDIPGNIDISGFCNNNEYGVNFRFNTMCNDTESIFLFSLFPYSNVPGLNSDFPISFSDSRKLHLGTMYANDPSIRLVSEVSVKNIPSQPKKDYFKLINLPNTLIIKKNNTGLDSLMKLNKEFLKNVVAIPRTNNKPSTSTFLLKKNKKSKK